jgi:hypothetical protein
MVLVSIGIEGHSQVSTSPLHPLRAWQELFLHQSAPIGKLFLPCAQAATSQSKEYELKASEKLICNAVYKHIIYACALVQ